MSHFPVPLRLLVGALSLRGLRAFIAAAGLLYFLFDLLTGFLADLLRFLDADLPLDFVCFIILRVFFFKKFTRLDVQF